MDISSYLLLSHFIGIGPVRFQQLMKRYKDVEKIIKAPKHELAEILGDKITENFILYRSNFRPDSILSEMNKKNIQVICFGDKKYPNLLRNISDPPICLYAIGDITILNSKDYSYLGIVGSRRMSSYGKLSLEKIVPNLVSGFIIVSGLALGVDGYSHKLTLDNKGKTIAVLGCGVDIPHPPSHINLYKRIIKEGGCILSEFPPGLTVKPGLFVARNRIISGLSQGILIVEGTKKSGSLITSRYAGEQGRDVLAIPGPITSNLSEAPNILIKQGAVPITCADDIYEHFQIKMKSKESKEVSKTLDNLEKEIYDCLSVEPQTPDDLCIKLKLPIPEILSILSSLQIKNIITKNSEGKFVSK